MNWLSPSSPMPGNKATRAISKKTPEEVIGRIRRFLFARVWYSFAMHLRYVPIDEQGDDLALTKHLFESAFPEGERPPFEYMLMWNHDTFYGVYDEDEFIGLADLIVHQDMVYLFFLAIEESKRGHGYGSRILHDLKQRYQGRRLFLLADEAKPSYPDYDVRVKRMEFYAKNGFLPSNQFICEFGVWYELLCHDCFVTKKEFVDTMASLIGTEWTKKFYSNV